MKIINILFCLLLLILSSCKAHDSDTLNNKNAPQAKNREKRDLNQEEIKSPEELLKEKLSDDQKNHLNWLKTALNSDEQFNKFLEHDESKIKKVLDHIKKELDTCNGNEADQQKETFKEVVKGALGDGIDNFTNIASSACQAQQAQ
ncbi:Mlp family lipoprotein [Borreliella americana]|uniref:Mlp family lipoprotein n=1 Tax=Borreliella americana TaxID=478807 RepID=UPI001E2C98FE|nr:Mlp family lipoprotein [Borreliella americana]MCD2349902.1 Mlp family lipoprotein [Borreliella americana]MCD2382398.1 Mlp family lipoprotein [Borreliella americana]